MTDPARRLSLLIAACLAGSAAADVTFTFPSRSAVSTVRYASVFCPTFDVNEEIAADNNFNTEDFDPWESEASSRIERTDAVFIDGFATHSSSFQGQQFVFTGAMRLELGAPPPGCDFYTADVWSRSGFTVETDEPVLIEISIDQPYRTGSAEINVFLRDYFGARLMDGPSGSLNRVVRLLPDLNNRFTILATADQIEPDSINETALDMSLTVLGPSCAEADISLPGGVLDLADIQAFVVAFQSADPLADLAPPADTFDLADLQAFVASFLDGCD